MLCFRKFLLAKKFLEEKGGGGTIEIIRRKFFVSNCRKNSKGNVLFCQWFRVSNEFMLQRVMLRSSVETFLSHSTETFCRRTLLCCVSENFCWRKSLWKRRGEGGLSKLSIEKFLSQIAEKFRREIF